MTHRLINNRIRPGKASPMQVSGISIPPAFSDISIPEQLIKSWTEVPHPSYLLSFAIYHSITKNNIKYVRSQFRHVKDKRNET